MIKPRLSNTIIGIFFIFFLFSVLWPLIGGAFSAPISVSDLDDSDPVRFSSRIMDIDYIKSVLLVAESEVMVVDLVIGANHFKTQLTGLNSEEIFFESLDAGQKVLVQGLRLADGRVVASMVQQLE
jgi:hypothetical protein